jgi:co-chaperonin GroES (HSP10)
MSNIRIKSLMPLNDYVLVSDMVFKERLTSGGIVLMGDDSKSHGVRPRWARVYAIGPNQTEVSVGQWICVAHGRWTRGVKIEDDEGVKILRRVDNNDILLVSDEPVVDDTIVDSV